MNKLLAGALIAAAGTTAACSSLGKAAKETNPAPCPNVVVLNDASRILEFDGDQELENIAYTGEIINVVTACRYFEDKPIDAEITVDMAFGRGPKGDEGEKYFKYFVAVTRKDLEVIAKNEFIVPVTFKGDKTVVITDEKIDKIVIPRASEETSGQNFEIIVGFSLTPEQAIFNRSGKSLKFPNLK